MSSLEKTSSQTKFEQREEQTANMLKNLGEFVDAEVKVSCEEYRLLEQLNIAASARYEVVGQQSQDMIKQLTTLSQKQAVLETYFSQIDQLYEAAQQLNKSVDTLELYLDNVDKHTAAIFSAAKQ